MGATEHVLDESVQLCAESEPLPDVMAQLTTPVGGAESPASLSLTVAVQVTDSLTASVPLAHCATTDEERVVAVRLVWPDASV